MKSVLLRTELQLVVLSLVYFRISAIQYILKEIFFVDSFSLSQGYICDELSMKSSSGSRVCNKKNEDRVTSSLNNVLLILVHVMLGSIFAFTSIIC